MHMILKILYLHREYVQYIRAEDVILVSAMNSDLVIANSSVKQEIAAKIKSLEFGADERHQDQCLNL